MLQALEIARDRREADDRELLRLRGENIALRAENARLRKVVEAAEEDKSNCLDFCKGGERCWMQNTCDALAALEAAKEAK